MAAITPMQTALDPPILSAESTEELYRLTVEEYERIGPLLKSEKVELIDGLLVKKMTKNSPHEIACVLIHEVLSTIAGWHRRAGAPVRIPKHNYPEPDISLVRGKARDYNGHPGPADVALVVEVADTTLAKARRRARIYGAAGIPCHWIVNLASREVEVYSQPTAGGYADRAVYKLGDRIPVKIDGTKVASIAVSDILP